VRKSGKESKRESRDEEGEEKWNTTEWTRANMRIRCTCGVCCATPFFSLFSLLCCISLFRAHSRPTSFHFVFVFSFFPLPSFFFFVVVIVVVSLIPLTLLTSLPLSASMVEME